MSFQVNNIVYCGFATNCLARSLRSHHHPVSSKSAIYPLAPRYARHRLIRFAHSPLAYIIAQLFELRLFDSLRSWDARLRLA